MEQQSPGQESKAFFDEEMLLWRMGGDKDDVKTLLEAFSMESQCFVEEIRKDIKSRDAFALRAHSESLHECASAISAISAPTAKHFARRMAFSAERNDFDLAEHLLPLLCVSLAALDKKISTNGWLA